MSTERRRIFAFSGVLKPQPGGPLLDFAVSLVPAARPGEQAVIPRLVAAARG